MRQLTREDLQEIHEEVAQEFPADAMMQELHEIRLTRYYEVRDLPFEEQLRHYLRPRSETHVAAGQQPRS